MKITVARRDLHPALTTIARIVEARSTLPILTHVLIEAERDADGGRLSLTATDLDMEVRLKIPAKVDEPGATTIHAARLHTIAGKLVDGDIDLETLADGQIRLEADGPAAVEVRIVSGRARFALQALPASDYPALETGELPHAFGLPADMLAAALEGVALAISTEETRYYLNGVYVHTADDRMTFVATDGHRLSLVRRDCPDGATEMPGVIVPRKTVAELIKLCRGTPKEARLSVSDTKIRIDLGDTCLVSKLIDGTFPDYERVIPLRTPTTATATLQREATRAAVDRVMTMNAERGRAVKVTLDGAEMELRLDVTDPDRGAATESVPLAAAEPIDIAIGLNGRYLAEALDALPGDTVALAASDPGSPVLMTPADDLAGDRRLIVVMPMRV